MVAIEGHRDCRTAGPGSESAVGRPAHAAPARSSLLSEAGASAVAYRRLTPPAQRLLAVACRLPGPDQSAAALAVAMACRDADLEAQLGALVGGGLIARGSEGRCTPTAAARSLPLTQPEARAMQRWYDWCLANATAAAETLYPQALRLDGTGPRTAIRHPLPAGPAAAVAWLDAELPTLAAAIIGAARLGMHRYAWLIADALRGRSWQCPTAVDWLAVAVAARDAARVAGDGRAGAAAYLCLADAAIMAGDMPLAIDSCSAAERRAARAGWLSGRAAALGNRGGVHRRQGRYPEALADYAAALELFGAAGRNSHKAAVYSNIAAIHLATGSAERAVEFHRRALAMHRQAGSVFGEARTLQQMAEALRAAGQPEPAERALAGALAAYGLLGDRATEAAVRQALDDLRRQNGLAA